MGFTLKLISAVLTLAFLSTILAGSLTTSQDVNLKSNDNVTTATSNDTTSPELSRGFGSSLKPLNGTNETTMTHDFFDVTEKSLVANVESSSEDSTASDNVSGNEWVVHKNISHLFISENDEIIERLNTNEGVQMRNVEESRNLVSVVYRRFIRRGLALRLTSFLPGIILRALLSGERSSDYTLLQVFCLRNHSVS